MIFQRVNQSDPEKIFISVYNSYSTASLTSGQPCMWDHTTDANGVSVTKPAAGTGAAIAGVAVQTIAAGAYGLIQVYGYNSSTRCRTVTGGAPAGAAGVALQMNTAEFTLNTRSGTTAAAGLGNDSCGFMMHANSAFTSAPGAVFLKCL